MAKSSILLVLVTIAWTSSAQTILGKWKSVDDNSGQPRSIVEISETGGKIYGKVIRLFPQPNEDPDPVCDKCDPSDPRFNKKVIGMEIIRGLTKNGQEYSGGDILDPENGKVYRSKLWLEGKDLKVRGYWGPFYRTQTWLRTE
jgi:uncharacterized protein (DUF2147 family)